MSLGFTWLTIDLLYCRSRLEAVRFRAALTEGGRANAAFAGENAANVAFIHCERTVSLRRARDESRCPRRPSAARMGGCAGGRLPRPQRCKRPLLVRRRMTGNVGLCAAPTAGPANQAMRFEGCVAGSVSRVKRSLCSSSMKSPDESSKALI